MNVRNFELAIAAAYADRGRDLLWLCACLMQESGELAELVIKAYGYDKAYAKTELLSEAGDVLNFLTAVLQAHDLTLEDAMYNNVQKLKDRGWIQ